MREKTCGHSSRIQPVTIIILCFGKHTRSYLEYRNWDFESIIGIIKVCLIHLNDVYYKRKLEFIAYWILEDT